MDMSPGATGGGLIGPSNGGGPSNTGAAGHKGGLTSLSAPHLPDAAPGLGSNQATASLLRSAGRAGSPSVSGVECWD